MKSTTIRKNEVATLFADLESSSAPAADAPQDVQAKIPVGDVFIDITVGVPSSGAVVIDVASRSNYGTAHVITGADVADPEVVPAPAEVVPAHVPDGVHDDSAAQTTVLGHVQEDVPT